MTHMLFNEHGITRQSEELGDRIRVSDRARLKTINETSRLQLFIAKSEKTTAKNGRGAIAFGSRSHHANGNAKE